MSPRNFREAVFDEYGLECLVCGRSPENGYDRSQELSVHHLNGDKTDNRPENGIPVCQSCHIHIHRTDEPPYRQWHRQLYVEHRSVWNQHTDLSYNGPHLTRDLAERLYGNEEGTPEAVKYLDDDDDDDDDGTTGATEIP
ncbi:HNH endonuclease signature motif containing protein [Halobacterium salinarum]|nr:HNH endonuclease signature motif containing protein [Halobacterium salinarum]MDL0142599.1 HNH endonuclease signature motif containing protein [Halobacterium salinarum]